MPNGTGGGGPDIIDLKPWYPPEKTPKDILPEGTAIPDPVKIGGYRTDANGKFILDEDGNKIPSIPDLEGSEIAKASLVTIGYEKNADGSFKKDAQGNTIPITASQPTDETTKTVAQDKILQAGVSTETKQKAQTYKTYTADQIEEDPSISHAVGTISADALAVTVGVEKIGPIAGVKVEVPEGALIERVTGVLTHGAKATAAKITGTSLPRITRSKKQLRKAGLSEEDISAIGNDPEDLESRLTDFTEEQRGLIAGLPEEALVSTQLAALLDGIEEGIIPIWARPAVSSIEQMLAERGLEVSTVGRDNLVNALIQSATPIAQANAQAIQASIAQQKSIDTQIAIREGEFKQEAGLQRAQATFNLDMAQFTADQTREVGNSQFFQTIGLTESSYEQESYIKSAVLLSQENLAQADIDQRRAIQHAQSFLGMDMADLSNEQASLVIEANQKQERMLSDQSSENASLQFNATSKSQTDQFMANLESETSTFNAQQNNVMQQFNITQENEAEARRVNNEADVNKFNAELTAQIQEVNATQEFNRAAFNATNQFAVNQSNAVWRRQVNTANTAAQNAVNMQNSMNALNMTMTEQSQMWQELRDQADYDFRAYENEQNRIAQLVATAIASDPDKYSYLSANITELIKQLGSV